MEELGLVKSSWSTEGSGPARRLYQITSEGMEHLRAWAVHLGKTRDLLEDFLKEFQNTLDSKEKE
jgi:DNA-binding PadR family transcriptional regulator